MPFKVKSIMDQRLEFSLLAIQKESNITELCRRFNITRRTGYKWISRFKESGLAGLENKSRRPYRSPNKTSTEIEKYIIALRYENPEWGSKKLLALLKRDLITGKYPFDKIPCKNTINKILQRNGLINPERSAQSKSFERFEYDYPNELWQMDFKGYFHLLNKSICHPLTITDDHSRFNICLAACKNQREETVQYALMEAFRKYGLPYKILTDNASPWGTAGSDTNEGLRSFTKLEKWLIQLNVVLIHGRPYHPQTQGKEERFHRTLNQELLNYEQFINHFHCQERFNQWREKYNCIRPHEAIDFKVPAEKYIPSNRKFPKKIKPYEYNISDIKRRVSNGGIINLKGKKYRVGKAFIGEYVGIRLAEDQSKYEVYYCNKRIRNINL